jgi:hypothetical protein
LYKQNLGLGLNWLASGDKVDNQQQIGTRERDNSKELLLSLSPSPNPFPILNE